MTPHEIFPSRPRMDPNGYVVKKSCHLIVHRYDERWSLEELSSAKEPQNTVLFGCIIDSGPRSRFRVENWEKPARGRFRQSTFFGFCLQNQGQIEFSTSAFLSLKVEGIARGLSWIAWLYLLPRRICAHIGPHPLPQLVLSISGFICFERKRYNIW